MPLISMAPYIEPSGRYVRDLVDIVSSPALTVAKPQSIAPIANIDFLLIVSPFSASLSFLVESYSPGLCNRQHVQLATVEQYCDAVVPATTSTLHCILPPRLTFYHFAMHHADKVLPLLTKIPQFNFSVNGYISRRGAERQSFKRLQHYIGVRQPAPRSQDTHRVVFARCPRVRRPLSSLFLFLHWYRERC